MNKDVLWSLFMGFILGVMVLSWVAQHPSSTLSIVDNAIRECEKSLPRDQHCNIIAVPVDKD